jgi:hypothetical protein
LSRDSIGHTLSGDYNFADDDMKAILIWLRILADETEETIEVMETGLEKGV